MKSQCFVPLTEDIAFKAFFKSVQNRPLLIALLNDFLPLSAGVKIIRADVVDSELLPETVGGKGPPGKRGQLDIKAECAQLLPSGKERSEIVNVEMQTSSQSFLPERLAFYACKLYAEQLKAGDDPKQLKNVYSLTFTTFNMPQFTNSPNYYHYCDLREREAPQATFTKALNFIVVELSKFHHPLEQLLDSRQKWCYFLKKSGQMDKGDGELLALQGDIMSKAVKSLWNLSLDEAMREVLDYEEKQRMDRRGAEEYALEMATKRGTEKGMKKGMEQGMQQGMKQGMQQGIEKGMQQGIETGRKETARKLLQAGAKSEFVAKVTGLSLEDVKKLK